MLVNGATFNTGSTSTPARTVWGGTSASYDFTASDTAAPSGGTITLASGLTGTVVNDPSGGSVDVTNGTGLVIVANAGTDMGASTKTAPGVRIGIEDLVGETPDAAARVRVAVAFDALTLTSNVEGVQLSICSAGKSLADAGVYAGELRYLYNGGLTLARARWDNGSRQADTASLSGIRALMIEISSVGALRFFYSTSADLSDLDAFTAFGDVADTAAINAAAVLKVEDCEVFICVTDGITANVTDLKVESG